jgi:tetratricopeptide (TPR) repeat protein
MTPENTPALTPSDWLARARAAREANDLKAALEECRKGMEAWPDSPDLLLTYGEVRMDTFNQDKNTEQLKTALISFEKVLKIIPRHYMANLLAARIYFKGKAFDRAEEKLTALLQVSPNDQRALELRAAVQKAKSQAKGAAEEERPTAGDTEGVTAETNPEHENLINRLSIFSRLDGVRSLHLIDPTGIGIKAVYKSGKPVENLPPHAAEIFKASALCCRNSGLGNFQRGVILTPDADIMFVNVFYASLVVILEPGTDMKAVEARVNRYVEALAG